MYVWIKGGWEIKIKLEIARLEVSISDVSTNPRGTDLLFGSQ